jgi:hypothetical protein
MNVKETLHIDGKKWNTKSGLHSVTRCCNIMLSRVYGSVTNNNGFWIGWLDLLPPSLYNIS